MAIAQNAYNRRSGTILCFSSPARDVLTWSVAPIKVTPELRYDRRVNLKGGKAASKLRLLAESGGQVELADQFIVFQLGRANSEPAIVECGRVEPTLNGSAKEPDVLISLEMLSFQLGAREPVDRHTRVTMRINLGKDESSSSKHFDTVFWSIAAGLNFYNRATGRAASNKDFQTDFRKAFGNRPIEIPGGLGRLTFEVVKHREPRWWGRVFSFLKSDTGESLISVLGFPALTLQAVDALDSLLNRIGESEVQPLFRSLPMRLAFSKFARDEFSGGASRIKVGALKPGFCVLARGRDFSTLNDSNLSYYPAYGKLVPGDISEAQLLRGDYSDPLKDVTYAVFKILMRSTKLDPSFRFDA